MVGRSVDCASQRRRRRLSGEMVEAARIRDQTIAAAEMAEPSEPPPWRKNSLRRRLARGGDDKLRVDRRRSAPVESRMRGRNGPVAARHGICCRGTTPCAPRHRGGGGSGGATCRAAGCGAAPSRPGVGAEMQAHAAELLSASRTRESWPRRRKSPSRRNEKFHALQERRIARGPEGEARRRHDETMAKLVLAREAAGGNGHCLAQKVARSEMTHLQDEAAASSCHARARSCLCRQGEGYLTKIEELGAEAAVGVPGDASFPLMPPEQSDLVRWRQRMRQRRQRDSWASLPRAPPGFSSSSQRRRRPSTSSSVASAVAGRSSLAAAGDEKTPKGATTGAAEGRRLAGERGESRDRFGWRIRVQ